ncbi:MAG: hypothetical protein N2234_05750 [Planctomycetota bacterium]|nr:hypothetical protein [Planctomycetota bacterium]
MRFAVFVMVMCGIFVGCAAPGEKVEKKPYKPRYEELAMKLAEIYEIKKANEWRTTGHKWCALAYNEWRKELQYYAFETARKSFMEAAEWFYLAKERHPEYADYVDEELKSVYSFVAMCIMERPELQEIPQAPMEEQREVEQAIKSRLEALDKTVQQWERMRGR